MNDLDTQKIQKEVDFLRNMVNALQTDISDLQVKSHDDTAIESIDPMLNVFQDTYSNKWILDTGMLRVKLDEYDTKITELQKENGVLANYILDNLKNK